MKRLLTILAPVVAGVLLVSVFGAVSCNDSAPHKTEYKVKPPERKEGDPEYLGAGYIRNIQWQQRMVMYEGDEGYTRILGPICKEPDMLPVWVGEHVYSIHFRWVKWHTQGDSVVDGCYALDWVGHDPARDIPDPNNGKPIRADGGTKQ
jgi:hypothetical protein